MSEPEILFDTLSGKYHQIGLITLNRPKALNALNQSMCIAMYRKLHEWKKAENIKAVVIRGAGERAFCAGGDIRSIYEIRHQSLDVLRQFFWHEYRLNHCIFHFPKPYIALLDGLTMGGGVGLSIHGSFRIGTEKFTFAMPETAIGFFPDIGGSYFLPRLPGKTGWYLGLTGAMIEVGDAAYLGIIQRQIEHSNINALLNTLVNSPLIGDPFTAIDTAIQPFSITSSASTLAQHRTSIDQCFSQNSVNDIFNALEQHPDPWTTETLNTLKTKSPTSLKVVFEQLKRGAHMEFDECMRMEYRMLTHFLQGHDFYEGIRAAIVEKDRSPHWHPDDIKKVPAMDVEKYFNIIDHYELEFAEEKIE